MNRLLHFVSTQTGIILQLIDYSEKRKEGDAVSETCGDGVHTLPGNREVSAANRDNHLTTVKVWSVRDPKRVKDNES